MGRNVELIVTDQRTYRSEEPLGRADAKRLSSDDFPELIPEEAIEILDAGRPYNDGHPPPTLRFGSVEIDDFSKDRPAQTILGAEQMAWFLERLRTSQATWKIWGNTTATLEMRADPQNIPPGMTTPWPGSTYAGFASGDHSNAYVERGMIYDFVQAHGITGFVTVAGDRHSFWAGLAAKALPPKPFAAVGIAFVTGSISAPGIVEALEYGLPKAHPLRSPYLGQGPADHSPQPTLNMLLRHGVRSCLEYARSGDVAKARALSNLDLSPHLSFVDMGGHGYSVVRCTSHSVETEFVCIPRPIERSDRPDGGPLSYRVTFRSDLWDKDTAPKLETKVLEGDPSSPCRLAGAPYVSAANHIALRIKEMARSAHIVSRDGRASYAFCVQKELPVTSPLSHAREHYSPTPARVSCRDHAPLKKLVAKAAGAVRERPLPAIARCLSQRT